MTDEEFIKKYGLDPNDANDMLKALREFYDTENPRGELLTAMLAGDESDDSELPDLFTKMIWGDENWTLSPKTRTDPYTPEFKQDLDALVGAQSGIPIRLGEGEVLPGSHPYVKWLDFSEDPAPKDYSDIVVDYRGSDGNDIARVPQGVADAFKSGNQKEIQKFLKLLEKAQFGNPRIDTWGNIEKEAEEKERKAFEEEQKNSAQREANDRQSRITSAVKDSE